MARWLWPVQISIPTGRTSQWHLVTSVNPTVRWNAHAKTQKSSTVQTWNSSTTSSFRTSSLKNTPQPSKFCKTEICIMLGDLELILAIFNISETWTAISSLPFLGSFYPGCQIWKSWTSREIKSQLLTITPSQITGFWKKCKIKLQHF